MNRKTFAPAARLLRAVCFLAVPLAAGLALPGGTTAQTAGVPPASAAPAVSKPLWSDLNAAQQQALAPLAVEWDMLEPVRKNKWLAIANKFGAMKPEEQQRMQERMRDWVKLTPEQRRLARENYVRAKKLKPDQKSAQWEQYQQLTEEEKKKLGADTAAKKKVATLPPPGAQDKQAKPLPPIKATPKPVLEQSVTPKAANRSALQPSVPPDSK
ncbi:DUF3106 domain-containing protein [Noviherbaspirillum sp.]|uniref:DUF3106 domain-containing protein n=1 Tax=Noviherbaspirillum sp. TaxID=1926288 RepID=UPI002D260140|nr:DUF3106 domain-containing protein [Noviherbaspirillum sp.]HZW21658.1 DUF3106 domain-containing protein [Noviherbaspirillum sp.]